VIQKAFQTPEGPKSLDRMKAAGMMTMTYREREITRDCGPFPRPSRAPEAVTDTEDTRKIQESLQLVINTQDHHITV